MALLRYKGWLTLSGVVRHPVVGGVVSLKKIGVLGGSGTGLGGGGDGGTGG